MVLKDRLIKDGVVVLPDLYFFDEPAPIGKVKKIGTFKTKAQVDPFSGKQFLSYLPYLPSRIEAELVSSWPVADEPFASQRWHRDTELGPCIRAMVYLSDVTVNDGPLCYASGTCELKTPTNRMSDDEFAKIVPRSDWLTLTGPKGTAILFNIMGFHRGLANVTGRREALCFTFHA